MDVDMAAVELYGLPPEQFTAARNRLAKAAKDAGDIQVSDVVKALRKPTLAAWLANLLVRADPDGIHELTELGEQLRQAHLSADGVRLRQLTPRRHDLVQQLVNTARSQARIQGQVVSPQIAQRLAETLDAALIDPGAAQMLRTGQLTSALRHVGFGVVDETGEPAQLAPVRPRVIRTARDKTPTKRPTRRTARTASPGETQQRRRAELEALVLQAQHEYAEAEAERIAAETEYDAHEHLKSDLKGTIERLSEELEQARQQLRDAERRTRALQVELNRTTRNAAVAQRRVDANQQHLANFGN